MVVPGSNGSRIKFPLHDIDFHLYISRDLSTCKLPTDPLETLPLHSLHDTTLVDKSLPTIYRGSVDSHPSINSKTSALAALSAPHTPSTAALLPWFDARKICYKVHKHVCGPSSLADMRVLLERNGI